MLLSSIVKITIVLKQKTPLGIDTKRRFHEGYTHHDDELLLYCTTDIVRV